jgi:hypothetical protein
LRNGQNQIYIRKIFVFRFFATNCTSRKHFSFSFCLFIFHTISPQFSILRYEVMKFTQPLEFKVLDSPRSASTFGKPWLFNEFRQWDQGKHLLSVIWLPCKTLIAGVIMDVCRMQKMLITFFMMSNHMWHQMLSEKLCRFRSRQRIDRFCLQHFWRTGAYITVTQLIKNNNERIVGKLPNRVVLFKGV